MSDSIGRRRLGFGPGTILSTCLGRMILGSRLDFAGLDAGFVSIGDVKLIGEEVQDLRKIVGVMASPAAKWLKAESDGAGRVKVGSDLSVPDLRNVFVIGDAAASDAWRGRPVPGLAPAAKQGGIYIAKLITARVLGMPEPAPFAYHHLGSLATIGRKSAVADFGWIKLGGAFAWWLWGFAHLMFLVGGRNRSAVILTWAWSYFSFRASTRLITGALDKPLMLGDEERLSARAEGPKPPDPSS